MSKETKIILVISVLFTLAMGLSNIFVNILLWKKSNDFITVALYNLMHYIFAPITFIFAGWLAKKKNGVWSLRLGILFFIIFYGLILYIKDNLLRYIFPLGILFGIAAGFYWLAYHLLSFDCTTEKNRDTFNGMNGCSNGAANALAPIIGGYIIQRSGNTRGYTIVFACSLILFSVIILVSFLLKTKNYGAKLDFGHILGSRHREWTRIRQATAVWGLRDVVLGFLVSILIFKTTQSELSVGKLSLLAAILYSVTSYAQQKLIKAKLKVPSMYIGAFLMFTSVIGIWWNIGYGTLLVFTVIDAISSPFFLIPMSSASFNVINEYHEENLRAEYIINKEIVLNAGRITGTLVLIGLLYFVKQAHILNYYLLALGSMQLISAYFLGKMQIWKAQKKQA